MRWVKMKYFVFVVHFISYFLNNNYSAKTTSFEMAIVATAHPYHKILFRLGNCHKALLFQDQKIWPNARLNRVLDIYYKSDDPDISVSRVELQVVINNTNCYGYSTTGVGGLEFSGALLLPTNSGLIFYNLMIFTCNTTDYFGQCLKHMMQFYINPKETEALVFSRNRTVDDDDDHDHDGPEHNHKLCRYEWLADKAVNNYDLE